MLLKQLCISLKRNNMTKKALNTHCKICNCTLNDLTSKVINGRAAPKCKQCYRDSVNKRANIRFEEKRSKELSTCPACNKQFRKNSSRKFCSLLCAFNKSYKININNCWISKSKKTNLSFKGNYVSGRRFSAEIKIERKLTIDDYVRSNCSNKSCVNPNHLEILTRIEISRFAKPQKPRKLTNLMVNEVIRLNKLHWFSREIAKEINLSQATVCKIINRSLLKTDYKENILDSDEAMQQLLDEINKSLGS